MNLKAVSLTFAVGQLLPFCKGKDKILKRQLKYYINFLCCFRINGLVQKVSQRRLYQSQRSCSGWWRLGKWTMTWSNALSTCTTLLVLNCHLSLFLLLNVITCLCLYINENEYFWYCCKRGDYHVIGICAKLLLMQFYLLIINNPHIVLAMFGLCPRLC